MKKEEGIKVSNIVLIVTLFLFLILIGRVSYIALSKKVDNINIQELASKRTTKETTRKSITTTRKSEKESRSDCSIAKKSN